MKLNKRAVALLVSLVMLLTAAVGATVAYLIDRTENMENIFTPSRVACKVVDETNHTYSVENTGDTAAYVRVAVVVNWKNTENGNLYAKAPEFKVSVSDTWKKGSDGYYYYTQSVAPGTQIPEELTVVEVEPATLDEYELLVEVVASAIQATSAAVNVWSNGVATAANDGANLQVTPMQ